MYQNSITPGVFLSMSYFRDLKSIVFLPSIALFCDDTECEIYYYDQDEFLSYDKFIAYVLSCGYVNSTLRFFKIDGSELTFYVD